jgi:hypothetical protein
LEEVVVDSAFLSAAIGVICGSNAIAAEMQATRKLIEKRLRDEREPINWRWQTTSHLLNAHVKGRN